jgi:hypothetical protein
MRSGGIASPFLISALDWSEWSVSRIGRFNPGESTPRAVDKKKISFTCRKSNPVVKLVARRYTDWAIPAVNLSQVAATYVASQIRYSTNTGKATLGVYRPLSFQKPNNSEDADLQHQ